jgi:dienelactone hydrolase
VTHTARVSVLAAIAVLVGLAGPTAPAAGQRQSTDPVDCEGPAPEARPDTPEWSARDRDNMFCAGERHLDQMRHPLSGAPFSASMFGLAPASLTDEYREPSRNDNVRFRFDTATITNRAGEGLAAEIYRPCARGTCHGMPGSLRTFEPRYPAVVVLHGGGSRKELHWWSSQTLAEAGYMVVAFDGAASNRENTQDVLSWLLATPGRPTGKGQHNPFWSQLDRRRIGIAGHSMGGQLASVLGQQDRRISTIVSWDRGTGLALPETLTKPTLFFIADYACQANPVCQPESYPQPPPDPRGPGGRGREYEIVRAAGVDSMKVAMRAATHLDWTPSEPSGNRYVETTSVYYTLAWFDRYLKGDRSLAGDAFRRLTASRFDDSADRHDISQGFYDPARAAAAGDPYAGNVPYRIGGTPVGNRMSFYFPSKCYLTVPGHEDLRAISPDIRRTGCPGGGRFVRSGCLNSRSGARGRRVGPARLGRTRRHQRRLLRGKALRTRPGMDRYCATGGGSFRIGYPTRRLSRHQRRLAKRRVVEILTSSRRFSVKGIRPGSSVKRLRGRLQGERRLRIGKNVWFRARGRSATLVYKTRGRKVRDVGIVDRRLTKGARAARRFLRSWELRRRR